VRSYIGWDLFPAFAGTLFPVQVQQYFGYVDITIQVMTFICFATVMALYFTLIFMEVDINS